VIAGSRCVEKCGESCSWCHYISVRFECGINFAKSGIRAGWVVIGEYRLALKGTEEGSLLELILFVDRNMKSTSGARYQVAFEVDAGIHYVSSAEWFFTSSQST
jgi:hypothetical protein